MAPGGIPAQRYELHKLHYAYDPRQRCFRHNLARDLHCFVVWEDALPVCDRIRSVLADQYAIRCDVRIRWSPERLVENSYRLYNRAVPWLEDREFDGVPDEKIGNGHFQFFVVEDREPRYVYDQSVSQCVELVNPKVVEHKRLFRSWVPAPFRVHSSGNAEEFFAQTVLILGLRKLEMLLGDAEAFVGGELTQDLEGSAGWDSYEQLFQTLNYGADYLVLRNFESLPRLLEDADVDFLARSCQRLASVANVRQLVYSGRLYKGKLSVAGQLIPVDIRHVKDGYYDDNWEADMLRRKTLHNGCLYVPRTDDYFFSLLYHAKVQKSSVKPIYRERLETLARQIGLDWWTRESLDDDEACGRFLAGYMKNLGYEYDVPRDPDVYKNPGVIANLPQAPLATPPADPRWARAAKTFLKTVLPYRLIRLLRNPEK